MKEKITFKVNNYGSLTEISTYDAEYRSLMELIADQCYTDCFGDCGGMGRCGTCMVKTENYISDENTDESNEQNTLTKNGITEANIRLSCKIEIDAKLNGAVFEIINI